MFSPHIKVQETQNILLSHIFIFIRKTILQKMVKLMSREWMVFSNEGVILEAYQMVGNNRGIMVKKAHNRTLNVFAFCLEVGFAIN